MSEQNLNSNALITAETAQSIMDVWGSYKTHRPFKAYALHEVQYTLQNGSVQTFVCEDYIIKDKLATFSNVRVKTSYNPQEGSVCAKWINFYDSHNKYNPTHDSMYRKCCVGQKNRPSFNVIGYTINGDKTINTDRIVSIDSLETLNDEWYTLTEEKATDKATKTLLENNILIIKHNQYQMSEENILDVVKAHELIQMWDNNDEDTKLWLEVVGKFPVKWLGKLIHKQPVPRTEPKPLSDEYCTAYLKHFEELGLSSFDGIDTKYLYQYMFAGKKQKTVAEDVEYSEV